MWHCESLDRMGPVDLRVPIDAAGGTELHNRSVALRESHVGQTWSVDHWFACDETAGTRWTDMVGRPLVHVR